MPLGDPRLHSSVIDRWSLKNCSSQWRSQKAAWKWRQGGGEVRDREMNAGETGGGGMSDSLVGELIHHGMTYISMELLAKRELFAGIPLAVLAYFNTHVHTTLQTHHLTDERAARSRRGQTSLGSCGNQKAADRFYVKPRRINKVRAEWGRTYIAGSV